MRARFRQAARRESYGEWLGLQVTLMPAIVALPALPFSRGNSIQLLRSRDMLAVVIPPTWLAQWGKPLQWCCGGGGRWLVIEGKTFLSLNSFGVGKHPTRPMVIALTSVQPTCACICLVASRVTYRVKR